MIILQESAPLVVVSDRVIDTLLGVAIAMAVLLADVQRIESSAATAETFRNLRPESSAVTDAY